MQASSNTNITHWLSVCSSMHGNIMCHCVCQHTLTQLLIIYTATYRVVMKTTQVSSELKYNMLTKRCLRINTSVLQLIKVLWQYDWQCEVNHFEPIKCTFSDQLENMKKITKTHWLGLTTGQLATHHTDSYKVQWWKGCQRAQTSNKHSATVSIRNRTDFKHRCRATKLWI